MGRVRIAEMGYLGNRNFGSESTQRERRVIFLSILAGLS